MALQKAIESGDTDLIYLVLLHSLRTLKEDFFTVLNGKPVAIKLMIKFADLLSLFFLFVFLCGIVVDMLGSKILSCCAAF